MKCFAILYLASLACSSQATDLTPDASKFPEFVKMEIGVSLEGSKGFQAVKDGSEAFLAPGAQGGFHLWTTPRFQGVNGTVYLDRMARRVSDDLLVLRASRMVIEIPKNAKNDWWHQESSLPSFMCPPPVGVTIYDQQIEFTFELRNEEEKLLAKDTLTLMARCPQKEETWCRSICADS